MLQIARLSPNLLGDSGDLVRQFLMSQLLPDGGFADRGGHSDLYYTVFGLESLVALRDDPPQSATTAYLERFADGDGLDFVHLACLARCWANLCRGDFRRVPREAVLRRIEGFRSLDGGYAQTPGAAAGTLYAAFLALGAYEDFQIPLPEPGRLLGAIQSLRALDGAYSNQSSASRGLTTSTAAAVLLLRHLGDAPDSILADWLLARAHRQGGFFALPDAPSPIYSPPRPRCTRFPPYKRQSNPCASPVWISSIRCGPIAEDSTAVGPTTQSIASTPTMLCSRSVTFRSDP